MANVRPPNLGGEYVGFILVSLFLFILGFSL